MISEKSTYLVNFRYIKLLIYRWNEIIGTSHKLMKRFQLNLKNPREAMEMQRKYQSAITKRLGSSLDVILRHKNLHSLELTELNRTKLSTLINALNKLTSLKVLNAKYTDFIDDLSESSDSLKTISTEIEQLKCVVEIVHIFACCSVKKLRLTCDGTINENRKKLVVDFLKKQNNLEDLCLCGEAFDELLPDFIDLKCPLKKFNHKNGSKHFPYYEAFIRFLSRHVRSLTSLEVDFFTDPSFGLQMIHKYALENIVNLKHFKMDYYNNPDNFMIPFNELPIASQITKNLESLELCGLSFDLNINQAIFDLLPNLKHLNFHGTDNSEVDWELLKCISERCQKLESLKMFLLYDDIPGIIYFPKLKEIIIEICNDEEIFCAFINRHSQTLERITIEDFDDIYFTRSIAKAILSCPNLNYLKLGELTFGAIMMINEISSRPKTFTLVLPKLNSKFIFPDDKAIFYDQQI